MQAVRSKLKKQELDQQSNVALLRMIELLDARFKDLDSRREQDNKVGGNTCVWGDKCVGGHEVQRPGQPQGAKQQDGLEYVCRGDKCGYGGRQGPGELENRVWGCRWSPGQWEICVLLQQT